MADSMDLAHGKFNISVDDNIITVKLSGCFNEEGTLAYVEKITGIVRQFQGQPFAVLVDDIHLQGATPEAFAQLNTYNEWLNGQNIVAKAIVVSMQAIREMTIKRAPALKLQNVEFFSELSKAREWLKSQLAKGRENSA